MTALRIALILALACILGYVAADEKTKMILVVSAEGISTINNRKTVDYQRITNGTEKWLQAGFNVLTPNGERQMYNLGKLIRNDYCDFLASFNTKEFKMYGNGKSKSVASIVSIMTALDIKDIDLNLAADDPRIIEFLNPNSEFRSALVDTVTINRTLPHKVSVFKVKAQISDDYIFNLIEPSLCPKMDDYISKDTKNAIYQHAKPRAQNFRTLIKELELRIGYTPKPIEEDQDEFDWLIKEVYFASEYLRARNLASSSDADMDMLKDIWEIFEHVHDALYILRLGTEYEKVLQLVASPMIDTIKDSIISNLKQTEEQRQMTRVRAKKLVLFSGERINILALQFVMAGIDIECHLESVRGNNNKPAPGCKPLPSFSSNMLFEVVDIESKPHIRVRQDGEYLRVCSEVLDSEKHTCELNTFFNVVLAKIDTNWKRTCGMLPKEHYKNDTLSFVVLLLASTLVMVAIILACTMFIFFKTEESDMSKQEIYDSLHGDESATTGLAIFEPITKEEDFSLDKDMHSMIKVKRA